MRTFRRFACFDWSGQAVARPAGIQLAMTRAGADAPALVASEHVSGRWSRAEALGWLHQRAAEKADMLIGFDFSTALPFADAGVYFPGRKDNPGDAKALWAMVDRLCLGEPHLAANAIPAHPELSAHFRQREAGATLTGDRFEGGLGRLRITERACREQGKGNAASCFNLIGASQVGKASLTGMRVLHRLVGAIPVWPFDPVPERGPMLVEIYTGIAARAAGLTGPTKVRDGQALDRALSSLGSAPHTPLPRYDDHATDAMLGAAWLRQAADEAALWSPGGLTAELRRTEGWTFGVA